MDEQHHQIQQDENFEYFKMLLNKETNFLFIKNEKRCDFKRSCLDAIKWILDTRDLFEFHYSTAYLSLVYFDRFFSRRADNDGDSSSVRLTSVACLSLAVKMEESKAVELSDYNVNGYNFKANEIQEMELSVLSALEWEMNCVTPYDYLDFYVNKLFGKDRHDGQQVFTQADELILDVAGEIDTVEQRPSVVAAAAVLAVCNHQVMSMQELEIKMNEVPMPLTWGSISTEDVFSCYKLMQETGEAKSNLVCSFFWGIINFFKLGWDSFRFNN